MARTIDDYCETCGDEFKATDPICSCVDWCHACSEARPCKCFRSPAWTELTPEELLERDADWCANPECGADFAGTAGDATYHTDPGYYLWTCVECLTSWWLEADVDGLCVVAKAGKPR